MAQRVQTLFIDDIDGGEAEGTVRFELDGSAYEIDLSAAHREELRATLERYIRHGRKVGGGPGRRSTRSVRRDVDTIDTTAVRTWAREQGIEVKERGRVPANIVAQYRQVVGA
jgi:hypothetical protein